MIIKTKIKIFVLIFFFAFIAAFFPFVENFFVAKVSDVNVYVPGEQQSSGSGAGGTYIPIALAPVTIPDNEPETPTEIVPESNPDNPVIPPSEPVVDAPTGLLPSAIASLSEKIPEFANILFNLNIKTAQDTSNLQDYNVFLPGLKKITGAISANFSNFSDDQKNKIPTDMVFVLLGNGNIDALTRVDFSENIPSPEEVSVLLKYPMRLLVKPSSSAKKISGYVLFESRSQNSNLSLDKNFSVLQFDYNDNDNDGIYIADIYAPSVGGRYQIVTSINYGATSKDIKTTTLVDPEGYIYEKVGDKELRINDAIASLYKLNDKKQYELWSADVYGQENPQITDKTGDYSFLVPEGTYYLSVSADGYNSYKSEAFSVKEGKEIHSNIALEKRLNPYSLLNINTILIIILFCFVGYNFYKDWGRRSIKK